MVWPRATFALSPSPAFVSSLLYKWWHVNETVTLQSAMKHGPFPTEEGCEEVGAAQGRVLRENSLKVHLNACAFAHREGPQLSSNSQGGSYPKSGR